MARAHRRRHQPPPAAFSITTLLVMGFGTMAVLGGIVWLALAYNHAGLIAIVLPLLPIVFSFFIEQCRNVMEEFREDDPDEDSEEAPTSEGEG